MGRETREEKRRENKRGGKDPCTVALFFFFYRAVSAGTMLYSSSWRPSKILKLENLQIQ